MTTSDATVISLVTNKSRDAICETVVPSIDRALSNQHVSHKRLPITRDYIDWIVNETDTLTLAIDAVGSTSVVVVASRGRDAQVSAGRLANIAADLCHDFDAHTVFWNGGQDPISVADFLAAGEPETADEMPEASIAANRIVPRKVRATSRIRAAQRKKAAQMDNWVVSAMRAQMNGVTLEEIEQMELDERRAKTAPMRLSAWAISFTTAIIAAPLAIPLIVHNLVRGEDVRSGAMALGVAGLYAVLAQSGMAAGLTEML